MIIGPRKYRDITLPKLWSIVPFRASCRVAGLPPLAAAAKLSGREPGLVFTDPFRRRSGGHGIRIGPVTASVASHPSRFGRFLRPSLNFDPRDKL
jgi:hypothetical protein